MKILISLLWLLILSTSVIAQPLRFNAMTTNRTMVSFTNGEIAVWNAAANAWSNGVATGQSATQVSNIVNAVVTNVATTVILTATNFNAAHTFHLDWMFGDDATAKPNDARFPWRTPTNWIAAQRTYINNGTNYIKGTGRPGIYTNAHFTSASGGVSVAGPLWLSPTNIVWDLEGVEFYNPVTNECNTLLISNANNFIIHGLTLRSTRQSGTTNDRSGVLHGAIQIAGVAKRLKFDRITVTNYTRHCVTPAAGFISESTVYEGCHFIRYGATNTADFMGIDGQAIPLLANTLVQGCYFYEGTRGLETEGFIVGNQNSFGAIVENCTFNRISEASILIIPDFTPQNYYSVMIRDCFFNGTGMDFPYAILSRGGQRIRILNNYISDYYTGIMLEADATVNYLTQIKGNTVYLTDRPILCLDNQNEVDAIYKADITDNIIHGGTEFGMYLNINNSVVENNTITEVTAKGIWLAGNTTVNDPCQDNIIRNNQIWETDGTGLFIEATVLNTRVENNIIAGSTVADYNKNGATNVSEIWHTITGVGIGLNNPFSILHVDGDTILDGLLTVSNDVQFMSSASVTNFLLSGTTATFFPAGGVSSGSLRVGNVAGKSWFYEKGANQMRLHGSAGNQTFMIDGSAGNTFISGSLDVTNWTHLTGALTNTGAATFENSSVSMANLPGSGNYVANSNGFLIFTNAPAGGAGTPAGSSGMIQYHNFDGSFGGATNAFYTFLSTAHTRLSQTGSVSLQWGGNVAPAGTNIFQVLNTVGGTIFSVRTQYVDAVGTLTIQGHANATNMLRVLDVNTNLISIITPVGVGIFTNNPQVALHVNGAGLFESNITVQGIGPALWELYGTNSTSFATIATDDNATGILINTNHVIVTNRIVNIPLGGLQIGPSGAALTNVLYASGTLNFPDTPAGQSSDLSITVTGAADGDIVTPGVPSGSMLTNGLFFCWASNNAVWFRFSNNDLAAALNPASGTFRARVDKFRP